MKKIWFQGYIRFFFFQHQTYRKIISNPFYLKYMIPPSFEFQGKRYNYFHHKYNKTWKNERTIEIPIIREIVKNYRHKNILEVGNVLSHYFSFNHDILDKYEIQDDVINLDVVDYHPNKKYDLIISISTLEHVGWDETPKDPVKPIKALDNLKSLLTPEGKIVITLPLGYNKNLDKLLKLDKIQFAEKFCLKRNYERNKWKEVNWGDLSYMKYNFHYYHAYELIIGIIVRNN
ncbi:MAG: SAM-dependent methyltransferase [Promethearchaeota archaeon]